MSKSISIIGAGILGSLLAFRLAKKGYNITLFDKGNNSCSYIAAGMLSPFCELNFSDKLIWELGVSSLNLWPIILSELSYPVFFQNSGSIVLAHPSDMNELNNFKRLINYKLDYLCYQLLTSEELHSLEPELGQHFSQGLFFPYEGQIDAKGVLATLHSTLSNMGVKINFRIEVTNVLPKALYINNDKHYFDLVIDCRGVKANIDGLRPVRGEIITIKANDINLSRPIRLLHPKFPLYVVPKPNGKFLIGATLIESNDTSNISVRSALELLSTAFTINSAFAEARITEMNVGLRPTFCDNLPKIFYQEGLLKINGLYRHGFLISPKITELVTDFIQKNTIPHEFEILFKELNQDDDIYQR